jgi:hypothetical protein
VDAADATAEVGKHEGAPVLVEARAQALLIATLRPVLAAARVPAAVARGVDRGPVVGLASWERGRRSRCFVEPKSEQVFEAPR